ALLAPNLRESHGREVHRAHGVAGEGQRGTVGGLLVGVALVEGQELEALHGFHRHQVGVGAVPAPRQGSAVKIHQQAHLGGIRQDVLVVVHKRLPIAPEEIDFHPGHPHLLKASKLFATALGLKHYIGRGLRGLVPVPVRVVPHQQAHVFGTRILG
nr:hypothetical protein [Tanacetum cinerariifolium]